MGCWAVTGRLGCWRPTVSGDDSRRMSESLCPLRMNLRRRIHTSCCEGLSTDSATLPPCGSRCAAYSAASPVVGCSTPPCPQDASSRQRRLLMSTHCSHSRAQWGDATDLLVTAMGQLSPILSARCSGATMTTAVHGGPSVGTEPCPQTQHELYSLTCGPVDRRG